MNKKINKNVAFFTGAVTLLHSEWYYCLGFCHRNHIKTSKTNKTFKNFIILKKDRMYCTLVHYSTSFSLSNHLCKYNSCDFRRILLIVMLIHSPAELMNTPSIIRDDCIVDCNADFRDVASLRVPYRGMNEHCFLQIE